MPRKNIPTTGKKFGKLTVIAEYDSKPRTSICICDCGNQFFVTRSGNLKSGNTKACGCRKWRANGMGRTRLYKVWQQMIRRCCNPKDTNWPIYGGRGIKVCEEWKTFANFISDMGAGKKGWSIERINNNGDYELANCAWATRKRQNRNTRTNKIITFKGITGCVAELCERFNVNPVLIRNRLKHQWSVEESFTTPPRLVRRNYKIHGDA